jgi:predicted O-methyltransferase YrrM
VTDHFKSAPENGSTAGGGECSLPPPRFISTLTPASLYPEISLTPTELREETHNNHPVGARMQISIEQGAFLSQLIRMTGARRVIEVGTFTGYSSICMASALPADGSLVACDVDEKTMEVARRYWEKAGVAGRVREALGPGKDTLERLLAEGAAGTYDFAFIDADKRGYDT